MQIPVHVASIPEPKSNKDYRLFVVEKNTGRVRIVEDSQLQPGHFLDLNPDIAAVNPGWVLDNRQQNGFLSMAFHPDYASNSRFYVSFSEYDGNHTSQGFATVFEYEVQSGIPAFVRVVKTVPLYGNTHGPGALRFLPDESLLWGVGDGGILDGDVGMGGVYHPAQDIQDDSGKLHRLLTSDPGFSSWLPDNPFSPSTIWALGLRNPYGFDVGPLDLWVADPGASTREEINRVPFSSDGINYEWNCFEGTSPAAGTCSGQGVMTAPVYDYANIGGNAIVGGVVNDPAAPGSIRIGNQFLFAGYGTGVIEMIDKSSPPVVTTVTTVAPNYLTGFGQDSDGAPLVVLGDPLGGAGPVGISRIVETCDGTGISGCSVNSNSTGLAAELCISDLNAVGQVSHGSNEIRVVARNLPNGKFAMLYMRRDPYLPQPWESGHDCIGIGDPVDPAIAIATAKVSNNMALFDLDTGIPPMSGMTLGVPWHFQVAYSDAGGQRNTSEGRSILVVQ